MTRASTNQTVYHLFWIVLLLFSGRALAVGTPGMYWPNQDSYGVGEYPSEFEAAEAYGEARCSGSAYNGLHHVFQDSSYAGPAPGETGIVAKYDTYCDRDGFDNGQYVQNFAVYYAAPPACPTGETWNVETQQCELPPQEPETCQENGQYYEPDTRQCVTTCPSGASLDTYCLSQPEPSCSPSSPDYQGTAGWGDDHRYVCSGETSCGSGESYAFREMDDGSWSGVCVSDESNPPVCPGGFESVLEIYDDGFACGTLNEDKEDPTRNDSSDGDSDGDGQADDNGMAGQLEDIKGLLKDGNVERSNIGQSIKKGFGDLKDAISNIPGGGGGDSGSSQTEIVGEDGNAITWSGSPITMEVQDGLTELNAVQGEYESLIANIRSEMSASFGSFTGAGGLQDNTITLFGQTFNAGLSKFGADLSMIGSIILFAASFAALGIIMGARD